MQKIEVSTQLLIDIQLMYLKKSNDIHWEKSEHCVRQNDPLEMKGQQFDNCEAVSKHKSSKPSINEHYYGGLYSRKVNGNEDLVESTEMAKLSGHGLGGRKAIPEYAPRETGCMRGHETNFDLNSEPAGLIDAVSVLKSAFA